jgi:hypothetical protein
VDAAALLPSIGGGCMMSRLLRRLERPCKAMEPTRVYFSVECLVHLNKPTIKQPAVVSSLGHAVVVVDDDDADENFLYSPSFKCFSSSTLLSLKQYIGTSTGQQENGCCRHGIVRFIFSFLHLLLDHTVLGQTHFLLLSKAKT